MTRNTTEKYSLSPPSVAMRHLPLSGEGNSASDSHFEYLWSNVHKAVASQSRLKSNLIWIATASPRDDMHE